MLAPVHHDPFEGLPRNHYGAILADPPWSFKAWSGDALPSRVADAHYKTMSMDDIGALPIGELAAENCALFLWVCWPTLPEAIEIMKGWGFAYKTCGFCWVKGNALPLFPEDFRDKMGLGYWTRANSEVCLLGTRGKPKRVNADVRQVIQSPLREHSRKPDETHERIERLIVGPYLELFARQQRPGWDSWGNETEKFEAVQA
jgi:N6-adenosine-specific RNA methylase IME4